MGPNTIALLQNVSTGDRNPVGFPSIPLENAEWMGHSSLKQKQKCSKSARRYNSRIGT
jgi:hypothetical protein